MCRKQKPNVIYFKVKEDIETSDVPKSQSNMKLFNIRGNKNDW